MVEASEKLIRPVWGAFTGVFIRLFRNGPGQMRPAAQ
jgi:hypothetical protein